MMYSRRFIEEKIANDEKNGGEAATKYGCDAEEGQHKEEGELIIFYESFKNRLHI